eukprot:Pgem_evm1s4536
MVKIFAGILSVAFMLSVTEAKEYVRIKHFSDSNCQNPARDLPDQYYEYHTCLLGTEFHISEEQWTNTFFSQRSAFQRTLGFFVGASEIPPVPKTDGFRFYQVYDHDTERVTLAVALYDDIRNCNPEKSANEGEFAHFNVGALSSSGHSVCVKNEDVYVQLKIKTARTKMGQMFNKARHGLSRTTANAVEDCVDALKCGANLALVPVNLVIAPIVLVDNTIGALQRHQNGERAESSWRFLGYEDTLFHPMN